jgi:hypothetical protein
MKICLTFFKQPYDRDQKFSIDPLIAFKIFQSRSFSRSEARKISTGNEAISDVRGSWISGFIALKIFQTTHVIAFEK